jgi:hypothetical protein
MIRTLRAYFLSRALREKILLVAFVAIGVMWWASSLSARGMSFWTDQRSTTISLAEQDGWIQRQNMIEESAKKTAARLDPTKTLNSNQLVTTVSQMANDAGLKKTQTAGTATTTPAGQFAVHSQEYIIREAEWADLIKFYESLQGRAPYITMERFILEGMPNNTNQHTLRLKVTSVEITR